MADDDKKSGIHVCAPDLETASREEKDIYITVIDNYRRNYGQIETDAAGNTTVDAGTQG